MPGSDYRPRPRSRERLPRAPGRLLVKPWKMLVFFENQVSNLVRHLAGTRMLERFPVPPFEDGYEGSPFNDFVGRLEGWEWLQDK
jgi:hypothetical protein